MKMLAGLRPTFGIALGLLLNVPLALSEELDCMTLQEAIALSERNFSAFRGTRRELPPDPEQVRSQDSEGLSYKRDEFATERRLAAATTCSVIVARAEAPGSIISESRYVCYWPASDTAVTQFGAIRKALQACAITARVEEDDPDNYALSISRVESGEGWGGVSVSAERLSASPDAGASVAVIHAVCQSKTPSGCDDAY